MEQHSLSSTHLLATAVERVRAKARHLESIDHLCPDAVVSFVDGEMPDKAMHRVRLHLVHCAECRAEIHKVRHAADWLRQSAAAQAMQAPSELLARLKSIAEQGNKGK